MIHWVLFLSIFFGATSYADENPLDGKIYLTDSARERCKVRDCLCKVAPGPRPQPVTKTIKSARAASLYFSHDSSSLDGSQRAALSSWIGGLNANVKYITVFSYTDGLGTSQYNRGLAGRRNQEIQEVLRDVGRSLTVRTQVVGEASAGYDPSSRRVDVVVHTERSLTTKIDKVRADVYLIDASGSMWEGYKDWTDVVNASFRPGSKVYLSIMHGCYAGQRIDTVRPQGGTEIWYSYWKVIESMKPGQTLAIVSDFQSNYPLSAREKSMIDSRVRQKNVKVIVLRP